ncbi:phage head closure protein [Alishewanella sp. 16-MA]|uniref:Phage head closure protein n=1 Tax=Alishewanella maricola TaxID=2795740 RepID=A0ABS8C1M3_9ALTE|nr:phage head closure protein [Alishewanella maricola]MCB5226204.1 phage head closure protein [Alishewanella maricola]
MAINAGAMRHRVLLCQKNANARNESGALEASYSTVRSFWAGILTAKQAQQRLASGMALPTNVTFHCRFMPNVTTSMAVFYQGKYHDITEIENPAGRNTELYLVTEHKL